ncbi:hypothetical protein [Maribacter ulvicola]|uniref:Uncharacterized protein n=1 Tax=Maribacter ulvicola TaxID=228959 RepID=A0A1N6WRR0_9FLAO|nr:hypothetical protein [Maribacter ulvicola]SIQ92716.1 hypothetical protein SAMN05421797_104195 [Maribacter ulvicola]
MKKILLIEDRPGRQAQFFNNDEITYLNSLNYLNMPSEDKCREWLNVLNSKEQNGFNTYNLVIVHKSSLKPIGLSNLRELCKKNQIDLILFSGGLSQVLYQTMEFKSLSINSSNLYTDRLKEFLENYSNGLIVSLLELVYGDQWKLEVLLRYRQLKTRYDAEPNNEVKFELEDQISTLGQTIKDEIKNIDNSIDKIFISI